jgi:hypothetical protein
MMEIRRLDTLTARAMCLSGAKLVCAYEHEEAFQRNNLEGAISLNTLKNLGPQLLKETTIIFYCA